MAWRDRAAARRRRVAGPPPQRQRPTSPRADAHPVEQQLELELRMGLDRGAGEVRSPDRDRAARAPPIPRPAWRDRGRAARPCPAPAAPPRASSRATAGAAVVMPAAQTKPAGGAARQRARDRARAAGCAARRDRSGRARARIRGQSVEDQLQLIERFLPVVGKIGQRLAEAGEPRRRDLLDQQLIERPGEILGQPQRLGGVARRDAAGRAGRAASAARAGSIAGGIGSSSSSSGSSIAPIRSSSSGSPTGTSRGSSRPPADRRTNASWTARAARLLGSRTTPARQPRRLPSEAARSARPPAHRQRRGAAGW